MGPNRLRNQWPEAASVRGTEGCRRQVRFIGAETASMRGRHPGGARPRGVRPLADPRGARPKKKIHAYKMR